MSSLGDDGIQPKITLSILADQLGAKAGGGRFTTGFLKALVTHPETWEHLERLFIVATQNESTQCLGVLPPSVSIVRRRFPSRLRSTWLTLLFSKTLPASTVAHGPFFYVFPGQAKRRMITFHDASFLDDRFHPSKKNRAFVRMFTKIVLPSCHALVCISDTVMADLKRSFPHLPYECVRIYQGVSKVGEEQRYSSAVADDHCTERPFILTVGTIEPRKNYDRILDAYEFLLGEQGDSAPDLVIVGREGWMCEATIGRIKALELSGRVHWMNDATDRQLAWYYGHAALFTYLSLYEGFGYPPFEAAFAQVPMVLSNCSAVGEIWSNYATCVDPSNVREIVAAWKWGLNLQDGERQWIVERQKRRGAEFTWERCVTEYLQLYDTLAQV